MSKSGVPIVSQVAEVANTVVSSIGDIFEGKNVFESLGRIIAAPVAAAGDLVNDISFNTLAHQPIAGDFFAGSREFVENPYSADAAKKLGVGTLEVAGAAITGGALAAGGFGVSAGNTLAATIGNVGKFGGELYLGSSLGKAVGKGDLGAAAQLAGGAGIENPFSDIGIDLSGVVNAIGGAKPSISNSGSAPSIGISNAVGAPTMATGMDGIFIMVIVAMIILLVFYYV